jgi:septal ring factor EnvC (AmiA/AmiB activator)
MNRGNKALIILLVVGLGAWGCAKSPAPHATAHAERMHTLENKCVKLEEDYRAVLLARDQMRKQMTCVEAENIRLEKVRSQMTKELEQHKAMVQERDQLRQAVEARTTERDALQNRCARLKKGLQAVLGEDNTLETTTPAPVSSGPENQATSGGQS